MILEESVNDCVGFTLDYQLIDTNTDKWCEVLGPRTVYVNNGEKWIKVGSFEYPEFGPVLVRVNLDEPTDIVAIGTMLTLMALLSLGLWAYILRKPVAVKGINASLD